MRLGEPGLSLTIGRQQSKQTLQARTMSDQTPQILVSLAAQALELPREPVAEAEYRRQWGDALALERQPRTLALAGGYLASQLPWVFVAGYQAAIRWVFPDVSIAGWLAFAASESRDAENPLPGVRRDESGSLTGWKTWVAAVNSIDGLLVLSKPESSGASAVCEISRSADGLTLHGPDAAAPASRFLGAMSQGRAELSRVPASQARELSTQRLRWFRYAEAISVYTALSAFLLRQSEVIADAGLREDVRELFANQPAAFERDSEDSLALAAKEVANSTIACAKRYQVAAGERAPGNWPVDRRLITMYAPRD